MSRARIKVNVASPASFTTPGSKADAEHACPRTRMQHHATTHDHTHKRRSTPPPHCSRMLTSLPGLTSRSRATPAQAHVAKANEIRVWACEMGNGPNPTPRAHARIAKPLTQQAPAGHRAKGGAPWVYRMPADFAQMFSRSEHL